MNKFMLEFQLHSFWQAGTGRGSGALLDMLAHRDVDGLPCLPGRSVKGLLRDAVCRAETWGYLDAGTTVQWFGSRLPNEDTDESRLDTKSGLLRVSDAVLPTILGDFLRNTKKEYEGISDGFFHPLYATAINPPQESDSESNKKSGGTAEAKSLRSTEVVIPLTLEAELETPDDWRKEDLEKVLPLLRAVGNGRNRGLGRVTVTLRPNKESDSHA
jgi:hypothetical protein